MTEFTFIDKSEWADGPWKTEPDKVHWVDEETGYDCLIRRSPRMGALCGYVGVKKNHPYYEKEYGLIDSDIEVHGGLTFSDFCSYNKESGICHPTDNEHEKVWWLGFDCGHAWDIMPYLDYLIDTHCPSTVSFKEMMKAAYNDISYKDINFIKKEIESLAKQLKSMGKII